MLGRINNKQSGAILIIMMLGLVLFVATVFLTGVDKASQRSKKQDKTSRVLAEAKELLISFALLSDKQSPAAPSAGYLPCPDTDGDGVSNTPCGAAGDSVEGWLPWQTLGSKPLKDGDAVCLRYAVSGNYKINPSLVLIKAPPTAGHFVIHNSTNIVIVGTTPASYALAVVFAPRQLVVGQTRAIGDTACGNSLVAAAVNQAANYLDQLSSVDNARGTYAGPGTPGNTALPTSNPSVFIQGNKPTNYNDELIWISSQDFVDVYARIP
ncbi:MAG: hypothetical protein COB26_04515 [Piscirickettsiaceae bacterium]|nr:MAG: hypothetical protein COB26_04515 [Piscirickettsiaceae bacterium]